MGLLSCRSQRLDPEHPLAVTLDRPARAIAGRLVDDGGAPVAGAFVWELSSPTVVRAGLPVTAAHLRDSSGRGYWPRATSDDEGRFLLGDLDAAPLRLACMRPGRAERWVSEPLLPGTDDLRWELASRPSLARVEGRVVAPDGTPLAGALVDTLLIVFEVERPWLGEPFVGTIPGRGVPTDAEGRFVLEDVPADLALLRVASPHLVARVQHAVALPDEALELVTPRRVVCELVGVEASRATGFQLLDEAGQPRHVHAGDDPTAPLVRAPVGPGASFLVEEGPSVLVLSDENGELARRPLVLTHPGPVALDVSTSGD